MRWTETGVRDRACCVPVIRHHQAMGRADDIAWHGSRERERFLPVERLRPVPAGPHMFGPSGFPMPARSFPPARQARQHLDLRRPLIGGDQSRELDDPGGNGQYGKATQMHFADHLPPLRMFGKAHGSGAARRLAGRFERRIFRVIEYTGSNDEAYAFRAFQRHARAAPRHDVDRHLGMAPIFELRRADPDRHVARDMAQQHVLSADFELAAREAHRR